MKKITNWLFQRWYTQKLREQQDSPFKMKMETDSLKSNCLLEITNAIEPLWQSIQSHDYKLGIKTIQNNRCRIDRDDFGKLTILPNPVFSQNQIADTQAKFWQHIVVILSFCTAETFLYLLTASLFVPGGELYMQIPVAIFLAVLIMLTLDRAFGKHYLYREVMERHSKKEISDLELRKFKDMRNIAYCIIALSLAAILCSGFARIFFLGYIPKKGLPHEKVVSITLASKMASIFTMLVTIITALFMAEIKREHSQISLRYMVFRSWRNAHVRHNNYAQKVIDDANALLAATEKSIQKHWQLVIDLKRLYKMKTEYDEKYEALHAEYIQLKAKTGFVLNDGLYEKFSVIQCAYEELFKYGILNAKAIRDKLAFATEIRKLLKEHLAEHLTAISKQKDATNPNIIIPPTNGHLKEHQFLTQ